MEKEILELFKAARKQLTAEDIRKRLDYYKNRFYKTLNEKQQSDFKLICMLYEKILEKTSNEAFHNGVFEALTNNVKEEYEKFLKENETQ